MLLQTSRSTASAVVQSCLIVFPTEFHRKTLSNAVHYYTDLEDGQELCNGKGGFNITTIIAHSFRRVGDVKIRDLLVHEWKLKVPLQMSRAFDELMQHTMTVKATGSEMRMNIKSASCSFGNGVTEGFAAGLDSRASLSEVMVGIVELWYSSSLGMILVGGNPPNQFHAL